jgi:iron complex outermembrane receptor protein
MTRLKGRLLVGVAQVSLGLLLAGSAARAADVATPATTDSAQVEEVIVTGVRGTQPRTNANSPVPIDIISAQQLTETGKTGLKEILGAEIPSLTLPAQNGGGTSASVPPIAVDGLRG